MWCLIVIPHELPPIQTRENIPNDYGTGFQQYDPTSPSRRPKAMKEKTLENFLGPKGRPMPNELQERSIVPAGYWENPVLFWFFCFFCFCVFGIVAARIKKKIKIK